MAAFDWINKMFQGTEQMRGLSGGVGSAVALDDANSFYNFRLRRHYTDFDVVADPHRLWFTNDDRDARTGLGPHIAEALTEGQRFTDVLIVMSEDDFDRATEEDASYADTVAQVLREALDDFLSKSAIGPMTRPLGVWLVREGAEEIGGADFGLFDGEFVTGLMPNLYRGPGPTSDALIGVHVNLPGVWEGYREVGRLFDDQVLFTLGDHWLDNFHHASLREAALYRLQRDADGAFFHVINPDLQDRYQVTHSDQGGTSVITLSTNEGEPLAHIVLAVLDADEPAVDAAASADPADLGDTFTAESDLAPPMLLDDGPAPVDLPVSPRSRGSKTIIPEAHAERIFTLQERGALLQRVHFSAFMLGYDVFLGSRGELGTVVKNPAATFEVRKKTVSLLANADNVRMDGEPIPPGESRLIEGDAVIEVGTQRLEYRELRGVDVDGWPYVGEIRRPASSTYMLWGREYTVGRSRDCKVVLPDEPQNANIVWKPKVGDGATIKSKTGEIPKSRFYTDSIMVASEHAAFQLTDDQPYIACRARHCYAFVRRHGQVHPLYPTTSGDGVHEAPLQPGDEVLVGNCLFHVGFTSSGEQAIAPAPAPRVSADSLVDALSMPSFDAEEAPAPLEMPRPRPRIPTPVDNLPLDVDEAAAPPKIDPEAEAALSAGHRSQPDEDEVAADEPPAPLGGYAGIEMPSPSSFSREPEPDDVPTAQVVEEEDDLAPPALIDEPEEQPAPAAAPPAAPPPVAPAPATPSAAGDTSPVEAPPTSAPAVGGDVVVVDDQDAQLELGRPGRLVQVGWMVNGQVSCGNHADADLVLPENRIAEDQAFEARTYFQLRVRGRRARLEVTDAAEVRVDGDAPAPDPYDDLEGRTISVIRRDDFGDEDFTVDLRVVADTALPDPRARLVEIDTEEPLAEALVVRGLPKGTVRELALGGLTVQARFDGASLTLSDYLATYRTDAGFRKVFVQTGGGRFVTAPEDGAPIQLAAGDRLVVDGAVYRFGVPG